MTSSQKHETVWVIKKADTGQWLGSRDRYSGAGIDFDMRVPLMWPDLRGARDAWMRYCLENEYVVKGVTLAREGKRYKPGPNYGLMPRVKFVKVALLEGDFEMPTPEELNIENT